MGEGSIGEEEGERVEIPGVELDMQRPGTANTNKIANKKWQKKTVGCFVV